MIIRGLQEYNIAAEVIGCRKTILVPRCTCKLCMSDPTISFKLCRRQFPFKIMFAMAFFIKKCLKVPDIYK